MAHSLAEFDQLIDEHKERKLADVQELEQHRRKAEQDRAATQQECDALTKQLLDAKAELRDLQATLAQRKADWDASVGRIQAQLEKREAAVKAGETRLAADQHALHQSQDQNRHQWTLLREAVDHLKTKLDKQAALYQGWQTDFLKGLPFGVESPSPTT